MNEVEKFLILGKMSAVLAHEIRNPLAGISAVTQVLEGKIDKNDPRHKYVALIMKEVDRVNKIVHDLLDFTRYSQPYLIQSDAIALADRALESCLEELDKKEITVEKRYESEHIALQADQEKIERVFRNIIMNAIEAMDKGGRLIVSICKTNQKKGKKNWIEIAFSDTGKGCDIEDINEMFSPFYTTKAKGTGLGLAVGLKVVEEHKGRLEVLRNPDKGLTMTVFLPAE
jgi:signal transduction histidine kinase